MTIFVTQSRNTATTGTDVKSDKVTVLLYRQQIQVGVGFVGATAQQIIRFTGIRTPGLSPLVDIDRANTTTGGEIGYHQHITHGVLAGKVTAAEQANGVFQNPETDLGIALLGLAVGAEIDHVFQIRVGSGPIG